MTQIVKFATNFYEDSWDDLYQIVKNKKWVSIYSNGKKYFLFVCKGRIFYLSEFSLSLILCSLVFIGIVGIRKLKLKNKVVGLIQKLRGGENEILHYEDVLDDPRNYHPISISHLKLTGRQRFIKSIIKRCLKPGRIYKITDHGILEIIDKIMDFKKKDSVKIISYDVFVLALIISSKPATKIASQGIADILKKIATPFLLENSPLIAAILTAAGLGFQVDLNLRFSALGFRFLFMLIKSAGVFSSVEFLRSQYLIDCTDYVRKLRQIDRKELPRVEASTASCSSSSKISYTREYPTRHETFVSTSPNSELHYQEDVQNFQIETLDGKVKQTQRLNGEKRLELVKDRKNKTSKPGYIPLESRTRTLDDVKKLDSTLDRESASEIIKTIQKEQRKASLIRESLDGE